MRGCTAIASIFQADEHTRGENGFNVYMPVQRHQQQRLQQQLLSAVSDGTTQVCI
jgi:hypothetical protein